MKTRKIIVAVVLAGILALIAGSLLLQEHHPWRDVEIENQSSKDIDQARVRFGEYECSGGFVGKTFSKTHMNYPHPITEEAEVHWVVDGKPKQEKLDLRSIVPKGKPGTLIFTIHDERVTARFTERK